MRFISGKFKGRAIKYLSLKHTRPLKDSVRENIFNILAHSKEINLDISKSRVLDLYSGIGSFGLECLSRNASHVKFLEQNTETFKILKENLDRLPINNHEIINDKVENLMNWVKNENDKYDIIFLDPPYADKQFIHILKLIKDKKIFKKKHFVIIHREKKSIENFSKILKTIKIKYYGRSKIIIGSIFE